MSNLPRIEESYLRQMPRRLLWVGLEVRHSAKSFWNSEGLTSWAAKYSLEGNQVYLLIKLHIRGTLE